MLAESRTGGERMILAWADTGNNYYLLVLTWYGLEWITYQKEVKDDYKR